MKLDTGTPVTGRMFASLVTSYVNAVLNGVPCIENALDTMAQLENTRAVDEGVKLYHEFMTKNLILPTNSDDALSQVHHKAVEEAVTRFLKKSMNDNDQNYQRKMNEHIMQNFIEWKELNEQTSVDKCRYVLQNLNTAIAEKMGNGVYLCNGGHAMHQQDLYTLQDKYNSTGGLGVKALDTLLAFLNKKSTERQTILKADEKLSAEEKKVEDQRQIALGSERQQQAANRDMLLKEQHIKDIERARQVNIQQLMKKNEEDLEKLKKHYEAVIESELKEQEKTFKAGFFEEARSLQHQTDMHKHTLEQKKSFLGKVNWKFIATRIVPAAVSIICDVLKLALR